MQNKLSHWLSVMALVFLASPSVQAKEFTWNKFGYSTVNEIGSQGQIKRNLYSTPQDVCNEYNGNARSLVAKSCFNPRLIGDYFCVNPAYASYACNGVDYVYSDTHEYIKSICTKTPNPVLSTQVRGATGQVGYNFSTGKCNCFGGTGSNTPDNSRPELYPDLDTGMCYDQPSLQISVSRDTYKPSEVDKPVGITLHVLRGDGTRLTNVELRLSVATTDGQAGVLSAPVGVTDGDGYVTVQYTFPTTFFNKKVDTIFVNCDVCSNEVVTFDMKMAPTVVGFFNGVWNTEKQANDSLKALKVQTNAIRGKLATKYELFYNQTGCGAAGATCLQDVAEVFALRSLELDGVMVNRWELFWDMLAGRHTSPSSNAGGLLGLLGSIASGFAQLLDSTFNAMLGQVFAGYSYLLSNPPTSSDVANHLTKLQDYADKDHSFVLVAHSQGNLFVNKAFDGLKASRPEAAAKVVHIAPASPTLRGDYVLADIDLVINGLRTQGITSVPPANIALPAARADASGHTLTNTYLDATRAALARIKAMLKTVLTSL
jgi:hypothetical protein